MNSTEDQLRFIKSNLKKPRPLPKKIDIEPRKETINVEERRKPLDINLASQIRNEDPITRIPLNVMEIYGQTSPTSYSMSRQKSALQEIRNFHVLFSLKACIASICAPGETTELYFSLYNQSSKSFISEEYLVKLTYNGMPTDLEKMGKLSTIFTDLSNRDISCQIFLVCRLIRSGRMMLDHENISNEYVNNPVRRPFGYAVLNISDLFSGKVKSEDHSDELLMKIYTPTSESAFSSLFENIIAQNGNYETSSRAEMICVSVEVLSGDLLQVSSDRGLYDVCVTHRLGFPEIILPGDNRNFIYLTLGAGDFAQGRKNVEVAVEVRLSNGSQLPCAIFIGSGETPVSVYESVVYYHSTSPKFRETIRLDIPYELVDSRTHVFFTYRNCSSHDKNDKTDRAFGFSVLPLVKSGSEVVIPNDTHNLAVFRYDKRSSSSLVYMSAIFDQNPESGSDSNNGSDKSRSPSAFDSSKLSLTKDKMTCSTQLCSTKLTQDVSLLNLLNWRNLPHSNMRNILKQFTFIGPVEIMKYLSNILDELFILLQNSPNLSQDVPGLAFSALIFTLNIVTSDRRFTNFKPILDVYIEKKFNKGENFSQVWSCLITSMNKLAMNPLDPASGKELRSAIKAWEYLFKFAIHSWMASKNHMFHESIIEFFDIIFREIISPPSLTKPGNNSTTSSILLGSQILVMQNLHFALQELASSSIMTDNELVDIIEKFISTQNSGKKKLQECKLQFCRNIIDGPLFLKEKIRKNISNSICEIVRSTFELNDASLSQFAFQVLSSLLRNFESNGADDIVGNYQSLPKLLPILTEQFTEIMDSSGYNEVKYKSMSCILSIWNLMSEHELAMFFASFSDSSRFLTMCFTMTEEWQNASSSSAGEIFLQDLNYVILRVLLKFQQASYVVMHQLYLKPGKPFDLEIWLDLIMNISRSLRSCPQKSETCNSETSVSQMVYATVASKGASLLKNIWDSLKDYHKEFMPRIVSPMLELTFGFANDGAEVALDILVELINIGHRKRRESKIHLDASEDMGDSRKNSLESVSKLVSVEVEIVERLDRLIMNENRGNNDYRHWLVERLQEKLKGSEFSAFLQSLDKFLSLAFPARGLGVQSAVDTGTTRSSTHFGVENSLADDNLPLLLSNLMHFSAMLERTSIYVKYIYELTAIHLSQGNKGEAGWALKHHADLLSWDRKKQLEPMDDSINIDTLQLAFKPDRKAKEKETRFLEDLLTISSLQSLKKCQSSFERKELIYLLVIHLLKCANQFENAISLCNELADQYQNTVFDFMKLGKLCRAQANLNEQIVTATRYYPEYFRVAFVGKGWDNYDGMLNLRKKQMIFAGKPFEKLGEFVDRMNAKYPGSELIKSSSWPPEAHYDNSEKRYLQICVVDAVPNEEMFSEVFKAKNEDVVPDQIKAYCKKNNTRLFSFFRPFKKSGVRPGDPNNEFLSLWTEKFFVKTEQAFPTFLKCSEVIEINRVEIAPIENAIDSVEMKTKDLENLYKQFSKHVTGAFADFTKKRASSSSSSIISTAQRTISSNNSGSGNHPSIQPTIPISLSGNINCSTLTMSLNGAVDAPVNGGILMYKRAFLSPQFKSQYPEYAERSDYLKQCIEKQVSVIDKCLGLHGLICPVEIRPLHDQLIQFFKKNFNQEINYLKNFSSHQSSRVSEIPGVCL